MTKRLYAGWDVGGWNCDRNAQSRDALVFLDAAGKILGSPWRGNVRQVINQAQTPEQWLVKAGRLCGNSFSGSEVLFMGIDTPLSFSRGFIDLIVHHQEARAIGGSGENPYLYRETEMFWFRQGLKPLSPVKDMIGSQATKGIHFLAKFARTPGEAGLWTNRQRWQVFETYPSGLKKSKILQEKHFPPELKDGHQDEIDAFWCALGARVLAQESAQMVGPPASQNPEPGWIWLPKDLLPDH
ncbi:MAG: hypothetical protein LAT58_14270 [Opitutales bacterium]|nr:hypothetical protein [Opitutales bacterium]